MSRTEKYDQQTCRFQRGTKNQDVQHKECLKRLSKYVESRMCGLVPVPSSEPLDDLLRIHPRGLGENELERVGVVFLYVGR